MSSLFEYISGSDLCIGSDLFGLFVWIAAIHFLFVGQDDSSVAVFDVVYYFDGGICIGYQNVDFA